MDKKILTDLEDGIPVDSFVVQGAEKEEGRISKQWYLPVYLKWDGNERRIFILSVYLGKEPYYKPWIELFGITEPFKLDGRHFSFFDSKVEEAVLKKISNCQTSGERVFIEYSNDEETRFGLSRGFPAVVTRLGYKLFELGYTWFKDWYFPEGFNEGGEKLQAEKAVDDEYKEKHMSNIRRRVKKFLKREREDDRFTERARERGKGILDKT